MKFGPVPVERAAGHILAHSVPLPGGRLRKGMTLGAGELAALKAAGWTRITVARLEPGDLHENAAAARLADALGTVETGLEPAPFAAPRPAKD